MSFNLDWASVGANGDYILADGADTLGVTMTTSTNAQGQTATAATSAGTSALWVNGVTEPVNSSLTFAAPVSNFSFDIYGFDSNAANWDDKLIVLVTDAQGNVKTVDFGDLTSDPIHSATGNVLNADGTASGGSSEQVSVTIPGPVSKIQFIFDHGESAARSGDYGIGNMSFERAALNDALTGTAGDDSIYGSEGDDYIEGEAGDDRVFLSDGFGNDTLKGGETGETSGDTLDASGVTKDITLDLRAVDEADPESGTLTLANTAEPGVKYVRLFKPDAQVNSSGVYPIGTVDFSAGEWFYVRVADEDDALHDSQGIGGGGGADYDYTQTLIEDFDGLAVAGKLLGAAGKTEYRDANGNPFYMGFVSTDQNSATGFPAKTYLIVTDVNGAAPQGVATSLGNKNANALFEYDDFTLPPDVAHFSEIENFVLGSGNDSVIGSDGRDNVMGMGGDDTMFGGLGDDRLDGGAGADSIDGGSGDNDLIGGAGSDTFSGGDGADWIYGGDDADLIYGGIGDVVYGGEGGDDRDVLDLSKMGVAGQRSIIYGGGNDESGIVKVLDEEGNIVGSLKFFDIEKIISCFTPGTMILTDQGERPVEDLAVGDKVLTRDSGYQTIRWAGQRVLGAHDLAVRPNLNPVCIRAGALGGGLPERDMVVSPQHRMLLAGYRAEMLFGEYEVLVPALHMVNDHSIMRVVVPSVTYVHLLFDQHEIIMGDGAWTESYQPGKQTLDGMEMAQREELLAIFPELEQDDFYPAARLSLKQFEAKALLEF